MLVLSRKKNEDVVISKDGVEIGRVGVADIRGDKIRLGFKFPIEIGVDRVEVWDARQAEAAAAAMVGEGCPNG